MATQDQIARNMVQQLRVLDPSISAEVGTPERRIIDTVAQAIANAQVDLNLLQGAFDIDAKFGTDLDSFLALFGFGRQQGTKATGYVTLSRNDAVQNDIIIRMGTTVFTPNGGNGNISVVFRTTTSVTLPYGETQVVVPIEAIQPGTVGNVAANTITESVGSPIYGITKITNDFPTTGGKDRESDSELKARFTTAGPFRNLAGTYDQFMALALATKSTKATVIGPISKYQEYIQIPSVSDVEDEGNGAAGQENIFTTSLSTNVNAKYIYDKLPHFVVNDSGPSPIHYASDFDYVLNIDPVNKNRGDAARNASDVDPTSIEALYRPNVTFKNVYIGNDAKPENAIAPEDILLFEYSYMSSASRNDFYQNVLNCVDVYVNNSDIQTASVTLPRPGNAVPTFKFTSTDKTSAFYTDKYRRSGEPGHRPIDGNIFTPLYHQPVTDIPEQISLSEGTFLLGTHYWLVEEVTGLYGTVRARNGIEWSSTMRSKVRTDADEGPFTGQFITDASTTGSTLKTDLPTSQSTYTKTVNRSYTITSQAVSSNVATLTISGTHDLKSGDIITVSGNIGAPYAGSNIRIKSATSNTISYALTNSNTSGSLSGTVTLNAIGNGSTNTTSIKVVSTSAFPESGYLMIGSEIIAYSSKTSDTFTISGRGKFGTVRYPINTGGNNASTVYAMIELNDDVTQTLPTNDYLKIGSEQIQYTVPSSTSKTVLKLQRRGANGTYVNPSSHVAGAKITFLLTMLDTSIVVDNYQYDENIIALQSSLENNKQVTTDVLAHKSKVRYFKPDVSIMYSSGVNQSSINNSIKSSLDSYFNGLYFGNQIQLSDILQTIHNTPGVDNVKWSRDTFDQYSVEYDTQNDARTRLIETNKFGEPISSPILDKTFIGNGTAPTTYNLYLPYLDGVFSDTLSAPTGVTISTATTGGSLPNSTTYYYVVTALNDQGETTQSSTVNQTTGGSGDAHSITINWSKVEGANRYRIYRCADAELWTSGKTYLTDVEGKTLTYTDVGSDVRNGAPSTINTAFKEEIGTELINSFYIQYGGYEPVLVNYKDLVVQLYDEEEIYEKNDIVLYGNKFYVSLSDDNEGQTITNAFYWKEDTVNKIGLTSKINAELNLITATSPGSVNFRTPPTFNQPITIAYQSNTAKEVLQITDLNINVGFGAYNTDFQIGDGELASLPVGETINGDLDLTSIMTVRLRSQGTWDNKS